MKYTQKYFLKYVFKSGGRYSAGKEIHMPKIVLTDVDGVLTNGKVLYMDNGERGRLFNIRDGQGFGLLKNRGIKCGFVSGEEDNNIRDRAGKLGLDIILLGIRDKVKAVEKELEKYSCTFQDIWYLGDDINDIEMMRLAGLSFCPQDIPSLRILDHCHFQLIKSGGEGVFREAAELLERLC